MRVCVVGSGAREHALASALSRTAEVVVTPGNPLISNSVDTDPLDLDADLFVIGPEAPLVAGLADRLRAQGKAVFGPGADGARLEGSKIWMKEVLAAAGVPTARFASFDEAESAHEYLDSLPGPFVIKTDGLAAGKGVLVTEDRQAAHGAIDDYLSGTAFGDAGRRLVIEEHLTGPEVSVFAICDGKRAVLLPAAQDHKRVGDGDTGPNTGGMGAVCPYPLSDADLGLVADEIIAPTIAHLRSLGIDYRGVFFAGLMMTVDGPKLLEYNVRFGDPEAEVVLGRVDSDLADLLLAAATGDLGDRRIDVSPQTWVTVVCAAPGYPEAPQTGGEIEGLDEAQALPEVSIFGAGIALDPANRLVTAGGRVLAVTGRADTVEGARARAYEAVGKLRWPGMVSRTDIAAAIPAIRDDRTNDPTEGPES